ncbi:hypothetical protein ED21_25923 [Erythrobacter sp. SD-21]|nr:hypothetical protein ED21_25923 [Erythrobacter sp. SD-21]
MDTPGQHLIVRRIADRHEARIAGAFGREQVDLVARCAQATTQHVAVSFHSPAKRLRNGMANMGKYGDFHRLNPWRSDMSCRTGGFAWSRQS